MFITISNKHLINYLYANSSERRKLGFNFWRFLFIRFLVYRCNFIIFVIGKTSLPPITFLDFDWSVTNIFSIHLFKCLQIIAWIHEADKPKTFCFGSTFVSNHSCSLKRSIFSKGICEHFISNFITQITAEDPIIIIRPIQQSLVFPHHVCDFAHCNNFFPLFFFIFFMLFEMFWLSILHRIGLLA